MRKKGKKLTAVATGLILFMLPCVSSAEQTSFQTVETIATVEEISTQESVEEVTQAPIESESETESSSDAVSEAASEIELETELETETESEPETETEPESTQLECEEPSSLPQSTELIDYQDSVPLPQNGEFEAQYFGEQAQLVAESEEWQAIFKNRVQEAIKNNETNIEISDLNVNRNTDLDQIRKLYRSCILGDCFFLSGGFSYSCTSEGIIKVFRAGYYSNYCDSLGQPDKAKIQVDLNALYTEATEAVQYASVARSQLEAALLLHDWLVRECDYAYQEYLNHALPKSAYNAYGALVNGRAVCNGYALAYSYLLGKMGINSYVLGSDVMNHAWNLLQIDGAWYHADLTSDDPVFTGKKTYLEFYNDDYSDEGFVYHRYFLKSDEEMSALGHKGWELQSSMDAIPNADKSGVYSQALFADNVPGDYSLIRGKWYFCKNGILYSATDLWGSNLKQYSFVTVKAYYSHMQNGELYFTDFKRIYLWNPSKPQSWEIVASESAISELSIKKGRLVYVTLNDTQSERKTVDFTSRFLTEIPTLRQIPYVTKVKLVWSEVSSADGYVIEYKKINEDTYHTLKRIDSNTVQTYSHVVKNSDEYQYRIRSFIQTGKERIYSSYSSVITGFTLPQKVINVDIKQSTNARIEITWDAVAGADGYVIYEKTDSGGWKVVKKIVGGSIQKYRTRFDGNGHSYCVRAFRQDGEILYYGERSQTVVFP